jgi:hypothetical protein
MIELSKIRIDGGTQPRAKLNQETVDEYAEAYKSGVALPPVTLFFDGANYWMADGFHRFFGAKAAGKSRIAEDITPGTLRDAILYSLSANSKHGLKRSNADKRKAVVTLLDDAEWSKWSNEKIAATCAVSPHTVADIKKSHSANAESECISHSANAELEPDVVTYTTKHGKQATMNTANIGKPKSTAKTADESPAPTQEPQEPEYTPLDEALDTIAGLQDQLALANAGDLSDEDKCQAADLISRLRDEVRILTLKLKAVTASRDQYQTENGELKKQIARQRREIDKMAGARSVAPNTTMSTH